MPEQRKRLKSFDFHLDRSSLCTAIWYLTKRSNLKNRCEKSRPAAPHECRGGLTHLACDIESPSMFTSNLCAGSKYRFVFGSMGRLTLLYSVSWTAVRRSKWHFRCFFSLPPGTLVIRSCRTDGQSATHSRVLGHSWAAFRIYSGPRTKLFQRLMAFRWSFLGLNTDASSLGAHFMHHK